MPTRSNWTHAELEFFKISICRERSFAGFFGCEPPTDLGNDVGEFIDLALLQTHVLTTERVVDEMSRSLLHLFDYDGDNRAIRTRIILDLDMSNSTTTVMPDLCVEILDTPIKLLLVHDDKSYADRHHQPEAQLCAEMIAAYQENVKLCERLGEEFPSEQMILGIVMLGTRPTFYVMKVTKDFSECVRGGVMPQSTTKVKKYVVPNLPVNISEALLSEDNRLHIAQCFEAFKREFLIESF